MFNRWRRQKEPKRLTTQIGYTGGGEGDNDEGSIVESDSETEHLSEASLSVSDNSVNSGSSRSSWNIEEDEDDKPRLGTYRFKIKAVAVLEPILVIGLLAFYISLYATGGTFNTESDYSENDTEHRLIEMIRDNHRVTSYKKKRKIELLFYIFTVLAASLIFLTDVLVVFDSKNKMAACLLWIWVHIWWFFICLAQTIRGLVDFISLLGIGPRVQSEDVWKKAQYETVFVALYYGIFFFLNLASIRIVKNRFLYLRKEAKSAQHSAGKRIVHTIMKRKNMRLKQKEQYYEREVERRASRGQSLPQDPNVSENFIQTN